MAAINVSSSWVAAIVSTLVLLGSGGAAYSSMSSGLAVAVSKIENVEEVNREQDKYDAIRSEVIDSHGKLLVKNEVEQDALRKTQEDMKGIMSDMLSEMKQMNENLIRLEMK